MTEQANGIQPENKSDEKPLAFTKRGKILAVLGGIPCGPLGLVASPSVLCLINYFSRKGQKRTNRFLIWTVLGIPAFISLWSVQFVAFIIFGSLVCVDQRDCMDDWGGSEITQPHKP